MFITFYLNVAMLFLNGVSKVLGGESILKEKTKALFRLQKEEGSHNFEVIKKFKWRLVCC